MNYEMESVALITTFAHFAQNRRLPGELFNQPDFVALHAADIQDFDKKVKQTFPRAEQVSISESEDRFVADIKLVGCLAMPGMGRIRWVEIIEPTDQQKQIGLPEADKVGFYYDDLEKARQILTDRGVPYLLDDYPAPTIRATYHETGMVGEFALSRVSLGTVVANEIESERAVVVNLAA